MTIEQLMQVFYESANSKCCYISFAKLPLDFARHVWDMRRHNSISSMPLNESAMFYLFCWHSFYNND